MIYGLVAEFNPLHNGHKYIIDQLKSDKESYVVAVMSGNFVQRGEPALISKYARAKAAIECGVDLVLELPLPYSISSAAYFAKGAINIFSSLGVIDTLAFGSECGDIKKLTNLCDTINDPKIKDFLKKEQKKGIPFAAALTESVKTLNPDIDSSILFNPNDTLGIEYISAARKFNLKANFLPVKRVGTFHNSTKKSGIFTSASVLRNLPEQFESKKPYMPKSAFEIYYNEIISGRYSVLNLMERAVITHLRTTSSEALLSVPEVSEGLENRLLFYANKYSSLDEILAATKSKRYTLARLRRIITASFLGVTSDMQKQPVPYIRILGLSKKGEEILSVSKSKTNVKIISSLKDAEKISPEALNFAKLEVAAGDAFSMYLKNPINGKSEYTTKLYKNF